MKDKQQVSESRRRFLRGAGISSGAVAVAVSLPGVVAAAPAGEEAAEKPQQQGYRLSQHVLDYYKSAAS